MTITAEERQLVQEVADQTAQRVVEVFRSELIEDIIPKIVQENMSNLGQDVSDQQEAQKDFIYLRRRRERSERIEDWKIKGLVTAAVTAVVAAVFAYVGIDK